MSVIRFTLHYFKVFKDVIVFKQFAMFADENGKQIRNVERHLESNKDTGGVKQFM